MPPILITDAQSEAGLSDIPVFVGDFQHIVLTLIGANTAQLTVKILGSNDYEVPDFAGGSVAGDEYEEIQSIDLKDQTPYDGDVGITFNGDDTVKVEVNTNNLRWIRLSISAYTGGDLTVYGALGNS